MSTILRENWVAPDVRTNLYKNPKWANGKLGCLDGWAGQDPALVTIDGSVTGPLGGSSLKVVTSGNHHGVELTGADTVIGQWYTTTLYAKFGTLTGNFTMESWGASAAPQYGAPVGDPIDGWQRYVVTGLMQTNTIIIDLWTTGGAGDVFWLANIQTEQTQTPGPYFDGDTQSAGFYHSWVDSAHTVSTEAATWPAKWTTSYSGASTTTIVPTIVDGHGRQATPSGIGWGYSTVVETVHLPELGTRWDITADITVHNIPDDDWFIDIFSNTDNTVVEPNSDMSPGNGLETWFGYDPNANALYGQLGHVSNSVNNYGDYSPVNIPFTLGQDLSAKIRLRRDGSLLQLWIWGTGNPQPVTPLTEYTLDAPHEGQYLSLGTTNGGGEQPYTADWDNLVVTIPVAYEDWVAADGSPWPAQWRTDFGGTGEAGVFDTSSNRGREIGGIDYGAARAHLASMPVISDTDLTLDVTIGDEDELYIGVCISSDGVFAPGSDLYPNNCYILEIGTMWGPIGFGNYIWAGRIVDGAKNGLLQPWGQPTNWDATAKGRTLTRGVPYHIRFQRIGTTVQIKFWLASDLEPTDWDFSAVEDPAHMPPPGRVTLSVGGGDGNTGTAYYSDLVVNGTAVFGYIGGRAVTAAYRDTQLIYQLALG